ncbi:MAG: glycosyltransferase [Nitrososphaerota archaeon]|nr:glycosyltransferase [Nitrososphaerota archaeon]
MMQSAERNDLIRSLKQSITVVIPTLNEENGVGRVIDSLRASGYDNIIVVDGYSDDNTVRVAESKNVDVIQQNGPGKAGSIKTALKYISTPYLLLIDADTTYDPADIDRFLDHLADYDEVIGARKSVGNIPILNRLGNWMLNTSFKLLFSVPITDVCSGMYVLKTSFAKTLNIDTTSFDVEVEIASQVAARGKITQVPIKYGKRVGRTKLRPLRDGARILKTIAWMANYYNPVMLYSGLVSLIAIPAAGVLSWVAIQRLFFNHWHSGYALFGVGLLLFASQAWSVGMISLLMKRVENRVRDSLNNVRLNS